MARATGANAQLLGKFETTYGTAPTGNFAKLPFSSVNLGAEQKLVEDDTLGNGRSPLAPGQDVITVEGEVTVPLDRRNIGTWLKGLLGAPTTTGTGPYAHAFTSGNASLPSLSLEIGTPEIPRYAMNAGVKVNTLGLKMGTSGNVSATFGLIGQSETSGTTSDGGTPTTATFERFSQFQGSVKLNGSALGNVVSADVNFTNNIEGVRVIRDDGLIAGADEAMEALTGSITVRFSDTTMIDLATAGTPVALEFGYRVDADVYLTFAAPQVHLPRPKANISGPAGIELQFDFQASKPSGSPMLTVTLGNDVSSY